MVLTSEERSIVENTVYEERVIETDLKPATLFKKVDKIRPQLHRVANEKQTSTYREVTDDFSIVHWSRIGDILGIIGVLEHELGNPVLPAVVINKKKNRAGDGFINLLRILGMDAPDTELGKQEVWEEQLKNVHQHNW